MNPDDLLGQAGPAEQHPVQLGLPLPEPGAGPGADVAALVPVDADVGAFGLELDGLVVLVAEDVERADHHAGRASGAQPGEDDLVVQVLPLGLVRRGRHGRTRV